MAVSYGSASGVVPPIEMFRLNRQGSLFVTSAGLADYIADREELLMRAGELFDVVAAQAAGATVDLVARHDRQKEAAARLGAGEPGDGYDVVIEAAGTASATACDSPCGCEGSHRRPQWWP